MLDDFQMVVHELSDELEEIRVYPLGDLHIGSNEFDEQQWRTWVNLVRNDDHGYVVIVGDLMDNGLRNSKTNPLLSPMTPFQQKEWLKRELAPIKHKILGVAPGNHEGRTTDVAGTCPLYDVCAKLDIEDLYRENMVFMKISLGRKNKDRQWSYGIVLAHGASKAKTEKFGYAIDGMDVMCTGHIHQPGDAFPGKIVMDMRNNNVLLRGFARVTVPSFAKLGGYSLKNMYAPQDHRKIPIFKLSGTEKKVKLEWI